MQSYALYVEAGPRRQKTYISIPELLGCMARGDTTDEAYNVTPNAIRAYLRFLQRHGEADPVAVDPAAPFTTHVAQRITEGAFLGNGTLLIEPDLKPLELADVRRYTHWLEWAGEDLREQITKLISAQSPAALDVAPEGKRSIRDILLHMIGSETEYLRQTFGKYPEISALARQAEKGAADVLHTLIDIRTLGLKRLRAMTAEERAFSRQAGQQLWTARKMMRRLLEHQWEHLQEIEGRL